MSFLWFPLAILAVFFYGVGQVLVKEGASRGGTASMLLLFAANAPIIWGGYWLIFRESTQAEPVYYLYGVIAAMMLSAGYVFYYEAIARGNVSVVGTVIAAFPVITVVLAWLILKEDPILHRRIGILLLVVGIILISYEKRRRSGYGNAWMVFTLLCLVCWGAGTFMAKVLIDRIGRAYMLGIYGFVAPFVWIPYGFIKSKGKYSICSRGWIVPELGILCLCFGVICLYGAMTYFYVSIVTPFVSMYPLITIVYARIRLRERLQKYQKVAASFVLLGMVLVSI